MRSCWQYIGACLQTYDADSDCWIAAALFGTMVVVSADDACRVIDIATGVILYRQQTAQKQYVYAYGTGPYQMIRSRSSRQEYTLLSHSSLASQTPEQPSAAPSIND